MTETVEYAERLQAVVDELAAEGASQTHIIVALIEVIVQTAYEDRRWAPEMLAGVAVLLSEAVEAARSLKNLDEVKRMRAERRGRGRKRK
jgi:hypothetical protein